MVETKMRKHFCKYVKYEDVLAMCLNKKVGGLAWCVNCPYMEYDVKFELLIERCKDCNFKSKCKTLNKEAWLYVGDYGFVRCEKQDD